MKWDTFSGKLERSTETKWKSSDAIAPRPGPVILVSLGVGFAARKVGERSDPREITTSLNAKFCAQPATYVKSCKSKINEISPELSQGDSLGKDVRPRTLIWD